MALNLNHRTNTQTQQSFQFDLKEELKKHAWHGTIGIMEAETILSGKPTYTYLVRPSDLGRGFTLSYVQSNGFIKHDHFTLIHPKYGIFRNGHPTHVGKLEKVIRDMMHCSMDEGTPVN